MFINTPNNFNKSATVIIGAGFGDEGKGLLTDFHAASFGAGCVVVRFNGGAQAGHTVVLPDGRRHVHSHFASGTLGGAKTFLSRYFVSNPLLFERERIELEKLGITSPVVLADDRAPVTTPYDMLINQWVELSRGGGRHGSCGVGFGETIERNLNEQFAIQISDLVDGHRLRATLLAIRKEWVPARLEKLKVSKLSAEQKELLFSDQLLNDFIEAATRFYTRLELARPEILTSAAGIVFEGAQGLLLDEDYGWFPHVTRSHTGLKNVVQLAAEAGLQQLDCVYATRAYATRHGAGPLPHELAAKPYPRIEDLTNIPNPHQGHLRFGWLDLDLLSSTINADFEGYAVTGNIKITKKLAVTCLDQLAARAFFVHENNLHETTLNDFVTAAASAVNVSEVYTSAGPTRETITRISLQNHNVYRTPVIEIPHEKYRHICEKSVFYDSIA